MYPGGPSMGDVTSSFGGPLGVDMASTVRSQCGRVMCRVAG
jgi:hypothetical protein